MSKLVDKRLLMIDRRVLLSLLIILILPIGMFGQSAAPSEMDCGQKLQFAESEFDAGHFYAIPAILKDCLESGLSPEQSIRAYLVLCQSYLILDDPIAAGDNYLKLLKEDPEFVPNEREHPIDIVYLSKKYVATPIFTPHFRVGANASFYRPIYSISTEPYGVVTESSLRLGFQFGAALDWNINENFSLTLEADIANRGYEHSQTSGANSDVAFVSANQWWIDGPLYLKYNFRYNEKIRPFVYGGVAVNYLLSASNQFSYTDNKTTGTQLLSDGPSESVTSQRNQLNRSWLVGGGFRYKIGKDYVYVDVRYMGGLSDIVNESTLYYENPALIDPAQIGDPNHYMSSNITRYHYLSDLFRMDNLSLSFGYVKPLYKPRKIKHARTKSVARNIRKEGGKKK